MQLFSAFFLGLAWLPKWPIFGRKKNLKCSPCLLSIYSLDQTPKTHSSLPTKISILSNFCNFMIEINLPAKQSLQTLELNFLSKGPIKT